MGDYQPGAPMPFDDNALQAANVGTPVLGAGAGASSGAGESMETRQPPDGDECLDFREVPPPPVPVPVPPRPAIPLEPPAPIPPVSCVNAAPLWRTNATSFLYRDQQSACSVRDKIAIFSNAPSTIAPLADSKKMCKSNDDILGSLEKDRRGKDKMFFQPDVPLNKVKLTVGALCKLAEDREPRAEERDDAYLNSTPTVSGRTRSSLDLSLAMSNACLQSGPKLDESVETPPPLRLHTRSQSLMDISSTTQTPKRDRWNLLAEQRQKTLSKLKGLVIPERVVEVDVPNIVDLPEIKSSDAAASPVSNAPLPTLPIETPIVPCQRNGSVPTLTQPPWSCNSGNAYSLPKYSPAFKRKSLQLHHEFSTRTDVYANENELRKTTSTAISQAEVPPIKVHQKQHSPKPIPSDLYENHESKFSGSLCLGDAPKSLESITSPTQSDCSFEYVSSASDNKVSKQESVRKVNQPDTRTALYVLNKGKDDIGRSEDESDNDSAVSSSQSSYMSRTSPPASPSHLHSNFASRSCSINESDSFAQLKCHSTGSQPHSQSGDNQNHRLLKPQSVEAINRKNILASAKCRSGRDLKIGSPLIQRKFEEEAAAAAAAAACAPTINANPAILAQISNAEEVDNPAQSRECATIYEKAPEVPANSDSQIVQGEISLKEENRLLAKTVSKVDSVNDSTGAQRLMPKESDHTAHSTKAGTKENGLKSRSVYSSSGTCPKRVEEKKASKEFLVSDSANSQERKMPIPRPKGKDTRASVTDLRKSFEKLTPPQVVSHLPNNKLNKSSSSAIQNDQAQQPSRLGKQLPAKQDVEIGTVTKPEPKDSVQAVTETIVLRPEIPGGSVGVTLAGGADYENKQITVHKIRGDSSAFHDGRLHKGDCIIAINAKSTDGLTHKELVALLKEPVPEVTLEVLRKPGGVNLSGKSREVPFSRSSSSSSSTTSTPPVKKQEVVPNSSKRAVFIVPLMKDTSGLGLSLEGGQDSPMGNLPLLIKKIFKGGAADKSGNLQPGDQLVMVNDIDVFSMSRFEVWSILKKLPEAVPISLTVYR